MEKLKLHSPDFTQENIAKLAELFPNCVTEIQKDEGRRLKDEKGGGNSSFNLPPSSLRYAIDFDQLRQELSTAIVEGPQERYQLNWPGKREALLTANAPIAKTLRPCHEESVDFDTTQNLFIEGDNLDALKLLQETYLNKVKMIYIDPPYNTGSDFIYEDDFAEDSESYFERSNQKDEIGNRMVANTEANGRFHSDWLTMMYPRLKLAQKLLSDDGAIFISIGDDEVANIRKLCDEIFGEDNFIATFVWKRRVSSGLAEKLVSTDHEYLVAYQKNGFTSLGLQKSFNNYSNPDNDPRGDWIADNLTVGMNKDLRPNQFYTLVDPNTGKSYPPNPNRVWAYIPSSMDRLISEGRIIFPTDVSRRPMLKRFKGELKINVNPVSTWMTEVPLNTEATRELQDLFGQSPFGYPKPTSLLIHLLKTSTAKNDLVLDFFAGSGTSSHAVIAMNAMDGGARRFIAIQLPELTGREDYSSIAEITKERIRRAGKKIKDEVERKKDEKSQELALGDSNSSFNLEPSSLDVGFRVLKIDSSNMKDVYYAPDVVQQGDLLAQVNNIREDRTAEDLLFQVLLDWGVDLALPITQETFRIKDEGGRMKDEKGGGGNEGSSFILQPSSFKEYEVFFVDGNALAACFETGINEEFVKALAARHPLRAVFRDAGFGSDSVKINIEQIFKLVSPITEVKSI